MQIQYEISVSLSEYNISVKNNTWEFPSYKDSCPMCKDKDCADGHGYYYRPVISEKNEIINDLPIKRYLCKKKEATFSLLPHQLVPYSKYRVKLIIYILDKWKKFSRNIYDTLEAIISGEVCEEWENIGGSHIYYFRRLFKSAKEKYLKWKKMSSSYSLERFIEACSGYRYCYGELLSKRYYNSNGGYQNTSQFLFGKASQFRCRNL